MSLKINSLSPTTVKVGWEGDLTINGHELGELGFVSIDGKDPKIGSWTATRIVVRITKGMTDKAEKKRLVVHDANGNFDETKWSVE